MTSFACVFPGQGSQAPGMLAQWQTHPQIKATFDQASQQLGYDLWQICQDNPEDKLNQTLYTQPALLTASVALWRVFIESTDARPSYLAGHSLGEYSALVCAEVLNFNDAVKLVALRAKLMQDAVAPGQGLMAAILGLSLEALSELCQQTPGYVAPANLNSPGQIVVAGETAAVHALCEQAKQAGAKRALPLNVSVPSHCQLVAPAAQALADGLANVSLQTPSIPVLHNVDAQTHTTAESIRDALIQQLSQPVQWQASIEAMLAAEVGHIVECGPGKVLQGLCKRIQRSLQLSGLSSQAEMDAWQEVAL